MSIVDQRYQDKGLTILISVYRYYNLDNRMTVTCKDRVIDVVRE
jgi:hypothetical protein